MGRTSIWIVDGRKEQIGITASESRIETLKKKRIRQYKTLIPKLLKRNVKKARRFEAKLAYNS